MKFGVALPHSGPLAEPGAIRRVAREAEALGFESVWVHDHITYDVEWLGHRTSGQVELAATLEPDFFESIVTLSHVAAITSRVRLGIAIIVLPLRDPRVLARQALTLQALSDGRLVMGVGTGDYPADFRVMEIPYADRAPLTEEYLEALTAIFPGGRVSHQGKTLSIVDASYFPKTAPIPLLMGGGIRPRPKQPGYELFHPALQRIAKSCDGWIPEGPPELVAAGLEVIRDLAEAYGRDLSDFEVRPASPMYLGEDDAGAQRVGRGIDHELFGSIATVRGKIDAYRAAGAGAMNVRCWTDNVDSLVDMLARFSAELLGD